MKAALRFVSDYRWPFYIAGHLTMSIVACAVLVWVATRPDTPLPIPDYYRTAQAWDADEAALAASRELGWQVKFTLPSDVPYVAGAPRPVDITVADRHGAPVTGLAGSFIAMRPSDARLNQSATVVALPQAAGRYRTLVRLDMPGVWEFRLDTQQQALRFVHAARITLGADGGTAEARR